MFFRKLLSTAQQNKKWLGAASVAGFGAGAVSYNDAQNNPKFLPVTQRLSHM